MSWEGIITKIHAVVDGLGNLVEFLLSCRNDHDSGLQVLDFKIELIEM